MSHSVTVTRTTTNAAAVILNVEFLKTANGALKLAETVVGAVCLGLVANYTSVSQIGTCMSSEYAFFYLVAFAFLVTTFLLLISALLSPITATLHSKSLFEFLFHALASIFYLCAGVALLVTLQKLTFQRTSFYRGMMSASVLGIVNAVLYSLSALLSFRGYRIG